MDSQVRVVRIFACAFGYVEDAVISVVLYLEQAFNHFTVVDGKMRGAHGKASE